MNTFADIASATSPPAFTVIEIEPCDARSYIENEAIDEAFILSSLDWAERDSDLYEYRMYLRADSRCVLYRVLDYSRDKGFKTIKNLDRAHEFIRELGWTGPISINPAMEISGVKHL